MVRRLTTLPTATTHQRLRESRVQVTDPQDSGHDSREQGAVDRPGQRRHPRRVPRADEGPENALFPRRGSI
jgi:hypothetical protein